MDVSEVRPVRWTTPGAVLLLVVLLTAPALPSRPEGTSAACARSCIQEGAENGSWNDDDFSSAQILFSGDFVEGNTSLGDPHRTDTYVLRDVPSGKVVNASCLIRDHDGQALGLSGWDRDHREALAASNEEADPARREWEALDLLCVFTGDVYIRLEPLAGSGNIDYRLHVQAFDPEDITGSIRSGAEGGETIKGKVSPSKWYPSQWYRFRLDGEVNGSNEMIDINLTETGLPGERLLGDIHVMNLERESGSTWLNQSWALDRVVPHEEARAAACCPGSRWYYLNVRAEKGSGGRSEDFELNLTRTLVQSDGDNHPLNATRVMYEHGKRTVQKEGAVTRGPDNSDWYKVYLKKGGGVSANLSLLERSSALFRLSIFRDNLTSLLPEKGHDLLTSWTNRPAETLLDRVNALVANATQEGWHYIRVMAEAGLDPQDGSKVVDWTVQTAWARYRVDFTLSCSSSHQPVVINPPPPLVIPEDGSDATLLLNYSANNTGVFRDGDFEEDWGDLLTFSVEPDPNFTVTIDGDDPQARVTIAPDENWNGEANLEVRATDLFGRSAGATVHVRVLPAEDPPFVLWEIPDFSVREGSWCGSMCNIDLYKVFSDPDLPPFGEDELTFTVEGKDSPMATLKGSLLNFNQAPYSTGHDAFILSVLIRAQDASGASSIVEVNITVLDTNRRPEFIEASALLEMLEDETTTFDLRSLFFDPDGDALSFQCLGVTTDNLTVDFLDDWTILLRPAPGFWSAQVVVRLRARDPFNASCSGEMLLRIRSVPDPPTAVADEVFPDPSGTILACEGEAVSFHAAVTDPDTRSSELRYFWSIDGKALALPDGPDFTWRTGHEDAGERKVGCNASDGVNILRIEWNVKIIDFNRPPVIEEVWPKNGTTVSWNQRIHFHAKATDPDGDRLTFYWRLADGTLLRATDGANDSDFTKSLPSGKRHVVVLTVADTRGGRAVSYMHIRVGEAPPPLLPDDLPLMALCVLGTAWGGVLAILLARRLLFPFVDLWGRRPPHRYR